MRKEEEQVQQAADDKAERERLAKEQRHATYAGAAAQGASGWMKGQAGAAEQAGGAIGGAVGMIAGEMFGGPIGAAIGQVIGKEVGESIGARIDDPFLELTNTFNVLNKGVRFAGQSLVQIAGNDGVGLLVSSSGAAADALERVPVAGKAAAAGLRLFGATVGEAKAVIDAFAARGKELSGYNSALAGSVARQDVALLLADIREADKLGPKLSRVIDAQTKLELLIRELLTPIKLFVADRLPAAIDRGLDGTTAVLKLLEFANPLYVATFGRMSEDLERMRRAAEAGALADPLGLWFAGLGALTGPVAPHPALAPGGPLPAPIAAFPPP